MLTDEHPPTNALWIDEKLSTGATSRALVAATRGDDGFMARTRWVRDTRPPVPVPASMAEAVSSGTPFAAAEALDAGLVSRHALRTRFSPVFPGVYSARGEPLTRWEIIRAATIWAPGDAIVGGWSAAYLHGETYFAPNHSNGVVDLFTAAEPRCPRGIRKRSLRQAIPEEDICVIGGLRVTAPARTTVDCARWAHGTDRRICMIDSLCFRTNTPLTAVAAAASRMPGQHGASTIARLLDHCDAQAQSPQETLLRLRIERSPLPQPTSQVKIHEPDGRLITVADLAYKALKVAIFYDGEHHGDPDQWQRDARITARLVELGWQVVRIVKTMSPDEGMRHILNAYTRARRSS